MKAFSNFDEAKKSAQYSGSAQLPAGAYVCKILNVKFEEGTNGNSDMIAIQFDIAEGDQKDFFKKQYDNNTNEDKKWKGATRIYVPTDDGSEQDGWTKTAFARWTNSIEASNDGYTWDWDENKWKGKKIGLIFGSTGTVIEGKEITYTECRRPCSVKEVTENTWYVKASDFKAKNGWTGKQNATAASDSFMDVPEGSAEEIPF